MGICRECKWWKEKAEWTHEYGECGTIWVSNYGNMYFRPMMERNTVQIRTPSTFSCIHFEQRAREPFSAHHCCGSPDMWKIIFNGDWTDSSSTRFEYKSSAEKLCSWLNEHWRN